MNEFTTIKVSLNPDSIRMLNLMAEMRGKTISEIVKQAISTESYIYRELQKDSKILVLSKDQKLEELLFKSSDS